jgi:hypothetical protein
MDLRRLALGTLVVFALLAPGAFASGVTPPDEAPRLPLGERTLAHMANATLVPGNASSLLFFVTKGNLTDNVTVTIRVDAETLGIHNETVTIVMPVEPVPVSDVWRSAGLDFTVPASASNANATYTFEATAVADGPNGTTLLATATGAGSIFIASIAAPVEPATPFPWPLVGAASVAVGGGALVVVLRQRAIKRRMNEGPRRSQVMREMELEHKLEKAKDPEQVQEIKQELRAQESVREKRRELQILEAKKADAMKTLDLLRKRHETGGLTKLQYENMAGKKRADLEKIEAEITAMEAADAGAAA